MQNNGEGNSGNEATIDYWQVIKNRYGVILLTFLLVFLTAAVITSVIPEKFQSTAVVQVHPTMFTLDPFGDAGGANVSNGSIMTRAFMENEFQVITTDHTLREAAESINLPERWGMDMDLVVMTLKGIIEANPRRGTDFIEITVRHPKKDIACDVAAAIAKAYSERRNRMEQGRSQEALNALDEELTLQGDRVQEKRKALTVLIQQYGIPYFEEVRGGGYGQDETDILKRSKLQLEDLKTSKNQLEIQIKRLLDTESDDLIRTAAGLDLPENQVAALYTQYKENIRQIDNMQAQGLGPNHPEVLMLKKNAENLMIDARKEVVNLKEVLNTKLNLVDRQVERMHQMVDENEGDTIERALTQTQYVQAKEEYEQARDLLSAMKVQQQLARVRLKMPRNPITIHEDPKRAESPVFPNVTLNLILGAGIGLIFGVGIAFLLEHLDTSVKSLEDVERYLQVPVLAVIPKDVGVLHKQSGMSPDAEAYRILRTNIEFNRKNPEDNSITVVSGGAGEGKSTTLVNLAYVCAQGGYTTLMIDADLRRPRLHTFFDINNSVGLTNYLTTELALEDVILQTPVDNLYFMPSGILPADAAGILNSRRMSELLQDVKQRFDLVLVDSPPILGVSDASVLASEMDLTMVVVQHRKLPRNMLMRVKQAVENVGGHVIGVVLNNVDVRSDSQYQYYTSYYTYYAPGAADEATGQNMAQNTASPAKAAPAKGNDEDLY
ncbi:MAG: GumC family protein [Verrucomicrobiales bacterium]